MSRASRALVTAAAMPDAPPIAAATARIPAATGLDRTPESAVKPETIFASPWPPLSTTYADVIPVSTEEMASGCLTHHPPKSLIGAKDLETLEAVLDAIRATLGKSLDIVVMNCRTHPVSVSF